MTGNMEPQVLVLDPDPASCDELVKSVRCGGYTAVGLPSVDEAIAYLRANDAPRVILLGANAASREHDQFAAVLRSNSAWAWIPVIVLTDSNGTVARPPAGLTMKRSEGTERLLSVVSRAVVLQKLR